MTLPALPPQGSTAWYSWAQQVHAKAQEVDTGRLTEAALRASHLPQWQPNTAVTVNAYVLSPNGEIIKRNAAGTTRATYDATEAGAWTVITSAGGSGGSGPVTSGTVTGQVPVWDGTTYAPQTPSDVVATDISFTPAGTIAAVNVQTAIEEVAADAAAATATAGGGGRYEPMVSQQFTTVAHMDRSTPALSLNRLYMFNMTPDPKGPDLDALAVEVTTAAATAVARLGIYRRDTRSSLAFTLLADAGTVDCSTIGFKTATIAAPVSPNQEIWLACVAQVAMPVLRGFSRAVLSVPATDPSGTTTPNTLRVESVTGALPSTIVVTATPVTVCPIVWARAV